MGLTKKDVVLVCARDEDHQVVHCAVDGGQLPDSCEGSRMRDEVHINRHVSA